MDFLSQVIAAVVDDCMVGMIDDVNNLSLAALIHAHKDGPQIAGEWLEERLEAHLDGYRCGREPCTRAWAVGAVLGTETLVQARPVVRDQGTRFADDFLRAPSPCTIAGFAAAEGTARPPRFGITRFHRWIAVRGEGELGGEGPEAIADRRRRLRADLPPFILRSLVDGSDRELAAMAVIARLHQATAMGKTYAEAAVIRDALRAIDELLGESTIHLLVSDGRTVGVLHRGGHALALRPPASGRPRLGLRTSAGSDVEGALLLLFSPEREAASDDGGPRTPKLEDDEALPIADGVFSVGARHPVRIERD